jgi:hypothetical protein
MILVRLEIGVSRIQAHIVTATPSPPVIQLTERFRVFVELELDAHSEVSMIQLLAFVS